MPQLEIYTALQFNAVIRVVLVTKTSGEPQLGRNRQEDFGSVVMTSVARGLRSRACTIGSCSSSCRSTGLSSSRIIVLYSPDASAALAISQPRSACQALAVDRAIQLHPVHSVDEGSE